jgi:hypothetical protein
MKKLFCFQEIQMNIFKQVHSNFNVIENSVTILFII